MSTIEDRAGGQLREGYAEIGDQRLHYVEAGEGPLVVLLHGFPEFWYGWRDQIRPLAAAGFRVVAPDMRGYNLSSKPDGVAAYDIASLTDDIRGLIRELGADSAKLVGHDWGGTVAWDTAMRGCSRAGRGRPRGIRRRRAAGSGAASRTRTQGSRAAGRPAVLHRPRRSAAGRRRRRRSLRGSGLRWCSFAASLEAKLK